MQIVSHQCLRCPIQFLDPIDQPVAATEDGVRRPTQCDGKQIVDVFVFESDNLHGHNGIEQVGQIFLSALLPLLVCLICQSRYSGRLESLPHVSQLVWPTIVGRNGHTRSVAPPAGGGG